MDLKQLRTFILVAETGSLSKASDRLRLAQPALSRQVKLLEAEIGHELFARSGRGMHLTQEGEELLSRVSGLVAQLEKSIEDVRSLSSKPAGQVALGLIPSVSDVVAGRVAMRVARDYPDISLRIVEAYAGHLIDWLHRGDIDAALIYGPSTDLHLRMRELFFEELVLVSPASICLPGDKLRVETLGEMKLVLPSRPHGLRLVVEAAAEKARVHLNVRYEADSFRVLKELVEAGLGSTVLPLSAFFREKPEGRFRLTTLTNPKITRQIVMALPSSRNDTRATSVVCEIVRSEIATLVASGAWQAYPGVDLQSF